MEKAKLHFVYNETSNPVTIAMGFAHRLYSPETYECRLCHVTYGTFLMKKEWKSFIDGLGIPVKFHLKDWFLRSYPSLKGTAFPAVFIEQSDGKFILLISAAELNQVTELVQLKDMVNNKLQGK